MFLCRTRVIHDNRIAFFIYCELVVSRSAEQIVKVAACQHRIRCLCPAVRIQKIRVFVCCQKSYAVLSAGSGCGERHIDFSVIFDYRRSFIYCVSDKLPCVLRNSDYRAFARKLRRIGGINGSDINTGHAVRVISISCKVSPCIVGLSVRLKICHIERHRVQRGCVSVIQADSLRLAPAVRIRDIIRIVAFHNERTKVKAVSALHSCRGAEEIPFAADLMELRSPDKLAESFVFTLIPDDVLFRVSKACDRV